jgi:hypothetical protein
LTSYILVDFENVQPKELSALRGGTFKVMVFVGPAQTSMTVDLAEQLHEFAPPPGLSTYVRVKTRGPNALDMHIAYYIGRIAERDPAASFHIISKDRDYDSLMRHLVDQGITCRRWHSIAEIKGVTAPVAAIARAPAPKRLAKAKPKAALPAPAAVKVAPAKAPPKAAVPDRVSEVVENLRKRERARPSTLSALTSTIKSLFRATPIADAEADRIAEELKRRGVIAVRNDKITYPKS